MNWTSLVLLSAVAISVPGEASAFRSAGDLPESHHQLLAANAPAVPVTKQPATKSAKQNNAKASSESAAPSADTSAELQKLEKRFFMHDFTQEPIEHRLQRMEKFTLGEVGTGTPDSRVAHLADILENHDSETKLSSMPGVNPPRVPPTAASSGRTIQQQTQAQTDATDYPHVTYLEDNILGQDFPGQPLETRLARLEKKAFGAPSQDPDFSNRTDALERYAEIHLRKKPFDNHQPDRSFAFADDARADDGPSPDSTPDQQIDPAAMLPTPPPESARLLSRVAWCEQHTLGKTYPEMHLLPRLHQLNAKLFPNDKTKDIQLMDHVDSIVKEVVLRQHPPTKQTT